MAKPIAIQINDIHLDRGNLDQVTDIFHQLCGLCTKESIYTVFIAGDIFESRTSQRLETLNAFLNILNILHSSNIHAFLIPGNHDKTRYDSKESFVDSFSFHPALTIFDDYDCTDLEVGTRVHFMPFFKEDVWLEKFRPEFLEDGQNILITHVSITGSVNNDGSVVESPLSINTFKGFDRVYSGHYHNFQEIKGKFIHCPSPYQANFGEDNKKGFTIIYDDLTYEIKKAKFKEYKKVKINLDEIKKSELDDLMKEYSNSNANIRFEVLGSESKVKSIKKDNFYAVGIDIKTKVKEVEDSLVYAENEEIISFNKTSLIEEFEECCEENDWEFETGNKYLERKLNG